MYAVSERRRVQHRVPLPVFQRFLLEQPAVNDAVQDPLVHALVGRELAGVEGAQLRTGALEIVDLLLDAGRGKVFQQVVVRVNAIAAGDGRMVPRKAVEVLVHEGRELGRGLGLCRGRSEPAKRNDEKQRRE